MIPEWTILRNLRYKYHLTGRMLAKKIGGTQAWHSLLESGQRDVTKRDYERYLGNWDISEEEKKELRAYFDERQRQQNSNKKTRRGVSWVKRIKIASK